VVSDEVWKNSENMKDRMLDKVERSNKIVVAVKGGIVISRRD
jgi:hypothetical protein